MSTRAFDDALSALGRLQHIAKHTDYVEECADIIRATIEDAKHKTENLDRLAERWRAEARHCIDEARQEASGSSGRAFQDGQGSAFRDCAIDLTKVLRNG